jgi:hypothetical protein
VDFTLLHYNAIHRELIYSSKVVYFLCWLKRKTATTDKFSAVAILNYVLLLGIE